LVWILSNYHRERETQKYQSNNESGTDHAAKEKGIPSAAIGRGQFLNQVRHR
jgi:hypothetical protein